MNKERLIVTSVSRWKDETQPLSTVTQEAKVETAAFAAVPGSDTSEVNRIASNELYFLRNKSVYAVLVSNA